MSEAKKRERVTRKRPNRKRTDIEDKPRSSFDNTSIASFITSVAN